MSTYSFQGNKRLWTPRDEGENRAIFSAQRVETGIKMPHEFKPIYLANAEYEVEKWSVKKLMRLLRLYGAHRCLWDLRDPDNRNRKLRHAALVDITAAMGDGVTRVQVLQKINVVRATYRYEKRRIKQRIRKGVGAKTKLKWFALADAFLRNAPKLEKTTKSAVNNADTDSDLEDTVVFTIDPETLMPLDEYEDKLIIKTEDMQDTPQQNVAADEEYIIDTFVANTTTLHGAQVETNNVNIKKPWTAAESLQFVQLLATQPVLWNAQSHSGTMQQTTAAIEEVAYAMKMPMKRIQKRVHTFRRAYAHEKLQIRLNENYKPNYVWWPQAVEFMETQESQLEPAKFVDANAMPPATPLDMQNFSIKNENCIENVENCSNAIPTPPPATVATVEFAEMYKTTENNDLVKTVPCNENVKAPTTKLIWNGLEDDLLEGKWSLKHSVKFLRLYGAHRCLWHLDDVDYRSRELRNAAIEDIAAAMGHGLTADYVAKKIKIFRITYMQQRKRMLAALQQGKQPEMQLRWFPLADSFLRPHIGLRSIKAHERELPQYNFQYVQANLNLIDPALLTDFRGKGTQNTIEIGSDAMLQQLQTVETLKQELCNVDDALKTT